MSLILSMNLRPSRVEEEDEQAPSELQIQLQFYVQLGKYLLLIFSMAFWQIEVSQKFLFCVFVEQLFVLVFVLIFFIFESHTNVMFAISESTNETFET